MKNYETKKRYKMYKSGKNWIVAPLVFLGLVVGVNINNANVSADTTAQSQATDSNQANTKQQEVVLSSENNKAEADSATKVTSENVANNQNSVSQNQVSDSEQSTEKVSQTNQSNTQNLTVQDQNNKSTNESTTFSNSTNNQSTANQQVSDVNNSSTNELVVTNAKYSTSVKSYAAVKTQVTNQVKNGWQQENGSWYYFNDGQQQKDWLQGGDDWYYFNNDGVMQTSWLQGGNDWYYFNPTSGRMQKNWLQGGNDWYYFNSSSGRMQKGWLDEKGDWYYFKNNGMMATGYYNGYLFSNSGKWISNFTLTGLGAKDFISQIGEVAKIVADEYGIYASMMIAQAGLESGWGSSMLSQQAHNLFGVKWSGKGNYVTMPTLEYYGGAYHTVNAPFAAYNTYYESLVGYATMIKTRFPKSTKSYSPTYQDAARNLRNGIYGTYATDPYYASKLISVINTYGLYKYDI